MDWILFQVCSNKIKSLKGYSIINKIMTLIFLKIDYTLFSCQMHSDGKCEKCGKKLDSSKEIPLCNDCERIHD